ncbi:FG-GAP repeat domain-containing protein [Streptomyces sp. NPDC060194]|uniref:FG-GAP repeat domain-containing protein n=1 Tax=Streptomyces sp. NPDC060194 TaxID=3347069 RepID=UPI003656691C
MRRHAPARRLLTASLAAGLLTTGLLTAGAEAGTTAGATTEAVSTEAAAAPAAAPRAPTRDARPGDDFNGDGYRDYANAVPDSAAGAVEIVYGGPEGPGLRTQTVDQDTPGVPGGNERGDDFGGHLAAADFDGDGYGDLAVGAAYEEWGGARYQGNVTLLWGSPDGLRSGTTLPNTDPAPWGLFGRELAAGDFDGDGTPDLAVINRSTTYLYTGGLDREDGLADGGRVVPLKRDDLHAKALVAGRVTGSAADDLVVIGGLDGRPDASSGAWFVKGGATPDPGPLLRLKSTAASGFPVTGTVADFDADGFGDIALGHPYADDEAGELVIWPGGPAGPTSSVTFEQGKDLPGVWERGDHLGSVVSAGDVDGDGRADLALGLEGEDTLGMTDTGGFFVLYGSPGGITAARAQWLDLAAKGVDRPTMSAARFGSQVRLRDADGDGHADVFADGLLFPGSANGVVTVHPRGTIRAGFVN